MPKIPDNIRMFMYDFVSKYDATKYEHYMASVDCVRYLKISNKETMLAELKKRKDLEEFLEIIGAVEH
jgi:hypothetical protein